MKGHSDNAGEEKCKQKYKMETPDLIETISSICPYSNIKNRKADDCKLTHCKNYGFIGVFRKILVVTEEATERRVISKS